MGLFNFKSSTLYWPGCYTGKKHKKQILRYKKILKKLGISFQTTNEINCCAGILINAGYETQARKLARENFEKLTELGIKKIITSCPLCYKTLAQDYEEMLPDWNIKVEYILQTISESLQNNLRLIKGTLKESFETKQIAYYDNCYLSRYSNICNEPREILKLLEINFLELKNNKKSTLCTGSCGNLPEYNPDLANQLCKIFIKTLPTTIQELIIADSRDFNLLKETLKETNLNNAPIITDLSELICRALKIKTSLLS
jgi:Fe-S oxidoreductase